MKGKRLFVLIVRPIFNRIIPPLGPKPIPDWERRGASITVNGVDLGTGVATSTGSRDTLPGRDEAGD